MKKKYKILLILFLFVIALFASSITYSIFNSNNDITTGNQEIAKFVFNAQRLDNIELPLVDLKPGEIKEYLFSVSNNMDEKISNVTIVYQITIKTYHFIPLLIELYKIGNSEELVLTCDETKTRNTQNELVCNSIEQELSYAEEKNDNYKLKVRFLDNFDSEEYSNLVDYIDLKIKSFQKIKD